MKPLLFAIAGTLVTGSVSAHEGHGHTDGYTIIHYLTEPVHAVAAGIAFVAGLLLWRRLRKSPEKKNG